MLDSIVHGVDDDENAPAPDASPDKLAIESRRFAEAHAGVDLVESRERAVGQHFGSMVRERDPSAFDEFLAIVGKLADEGIDVSRVRVAAGDDDLPTKVTFPVAPPDANDREGDREMHE